MRLWAITTVEEFTVAVIKQGILSDSPPGSMEIASSFELHSCPMGLPPHPQWCNLFWSFRLMWNETKFLGGGVLLFIILQFPRALHILPWLVLHLKCLVCTVLPTWFSISTSWLGRGSRALLDAGRIRPFFSCWRIRYFCIGPWRKAVQLVVLMSEFHAGLSTVYDERVWKRNEKKTRYHTTYFFFFFYLSPKVSILARSSESWTRESSVPTLK